MVYALIVAAGSGKRMGADVSKIFLRINGDQMICTTLNKFQNCKKIDKIVIVVREDDKNLITNLMSKNKFNKIVKIVSGGKNRQESVWAGLESIDGRENDIVVIHNAANPLVNNKAINDSIKAAGRAGAGIVGFKVIDTIKQSDKDGFVTETIDRKNLWHVQTPQAFKFNVIKEAYEAALSESYLGTDDAELVERLGVKVELIECSQDNIKITTPYDISLAETILKGSRVGFGMDSHRFSKDRDRSLLLGGIIVSDKNGFEANSDGDVILHAIFNAISQALGQHSLGYYADQMCERGIVDSREYLKMILKKMVEMEYKIKNISVMCEGKTPLIHKFETRIKKSLSVICKIGADSIGLIGTSGEGLTAFGRGEGMQCFCVVLLERFE